MLTADVGRSKEATGIAESVNPKTSFIAGHLQIFLNASLILLALILCYLLSKEIYLLIKTIFIEYNTNFQHFLEQILVFFLYFEFIAMIVRYFQENYHFPLRYLLYIGITAMIRLIIADHYDPMKTLIYTFVILVLTISYFIVNFTPLKR